MEDPHGRGGWMGLCPTGTCCELLLGPTIPTGFNCSHTYAHPALLFLCYSAFLPILNGLQVQMTVRLLSNYGYI